MPRWVHPHWTDVPTLGWLKWVFFFLFFFSAFHFFFFFTIMHFIDFILLSQAAEEANWNPYFEGKQLEVAAKKSPWAIKPAQHWAVRTGDATRRPGSVLGSTAITFFFSVSSFCFSLFLFFLHPPSFYFGSRQLDIISWLKVANYINDSVFLC